MVRSASASAPPTPALIAIFFVDDDCDDEGDTDSGDEVFLTGSGLDASVVIVVVKVAVAVMVTVASLVLFGSVDPDERLKITSPAGTPKGDVLSPAANMQVLLEGSTLLQQNKGRSGSLSTSSRCKFTPPLGLTAIPLSGWRYFVKGGFLPSAQYCGHSGFCHVLSVQVPLLINAEPVCPRQRVLFRHISEEAQHALAPPPIEGE